jgi:hypothetical protein
MNDSYDSVNPTDDRHYRDSIHSDGRLPPVSQSVIYDLLLTFFTPDDPSEMPLRLMTTSKWTILATG